MAGGLRSRIGRTLIATGKRFMAGVPGLDNTGSSGLLWKGANYNRLTEDWVWAPIASADETIRWDIYRLRARARELRRNNPYVARFGEMVRENVVGHDGMKLQARVTRPGGGQDTGINDRIEEAWAAWSMPDQASADGVLSWLDQEWMAAENVAIDGEALIHMVRGFPNDFGFAIEALDPDLLDHTYNRPAGAHENEIRMGVEIDSWGRPVGYWLWTRHPYDINGSGDREREFVPASDIIHLHRQRRPGQTRSVTWLAPVMIPLKMLGGFAEAELVAARTAAAQMGFYIQGPEAIADPDSPAGGGGLGNGELMMDAEPGSMSLLPPGITDMKAFAPNHPNVQFDQFVKSIVRWVSGGLSVSYNALGNDLESVNYSSIRAGLLNERDHWRSLQNWMQTHLHRRVYHEWLKWATTTGAVPLQARNMSRWFDHRWMPRGWPWVDPLKDVQAASDALQLNLMSRQRLMAQEGRDFEEILRERKEEADLAEEYGITLTDVLGSERIKTTPVSPPQVEPDDAGSEPTDTSEPDETDEPAVTPPARAEVLAALKSNHTNGKKSRRR